MDNLANITVRKVIQIKAVNPSSERMGTNLHFVTVSQEYNLVCVHKTSVFLEAEPNVHGETLLLAITTRNDTSVGMFIFPFMRIPVFLQNITKSFMHYCHV